MSKEHSIYFMCVDVPKDEGEFAEFVERIEFVTVKNISWIAQLVRSAFYMLLGVPRFISACASQTMQARVREVVEQNTFDGILLYDMDAIQYFQPTCYKQMIVNIEDPQSIKLHRMYRLPNLSPWEKVKLFVDARVLARYEKRYLPQMAKVVVLSEEDAKDLREEGRYDNIGCVSYGVNRRSMEEILRCEERTDGMIIFSGSMFHLPNVDGAVYFVRHIFEFVLKEYPTATLWIVGAEPDSRIRNATVAFGERVVITGRVNDMSDYLRRAKVSICPVRLKIGVQTKILEALSWGTPVVTTSAGNSGVDGFSGKDLWVEDNPSTFAKRVVQLLRGENWNRLSEGGRELVHKRFSWERGSAELEQHIMTIHGGGSQR
jgi:glycosyltransferase involved in cell wall biosynthesis